MSHRKMTPKGQMASNGSGPAIMMMPPHIRATFMPDPPLKHLPPPIKKRGIRYVSDNDEEDSKSSRPKIKGGLTGLSAFLPHFERTAPPERKIGPTPASTKTAKRKKKLEANEKKIEPIIAAYRKEQLDCGGEFEGMNCYNTLFVGRLAYEVTERKLLREFEVFGPVKDLKIVYDTSSKDDDDRDVEENGGGGGSGEKKSRGYAFVEYEHEDDMKRAYRNADGMRVEGRCVVVDVERGHTVLNWLPRRLGGGLGGTRIGGREKNVTAPGRFDPSKPQAPPPPQQHPMGGGGPPGPGGPPPPGYGGPPPHHMGGGPGRGGPDGPPPPGYHPHPMMRGGGGGGGRGGPPPPGRGGPPLGYGGRDGPGGPPPPGYGGGPYGPPRGDGGRYGGPPRGGGGDYYGGGGPGGMKRRRSRSRSPERRRGRY